MAQDYCWNHRSIDNEFIRELSEGGLLYPFVKTTKEDPSLSLEIRAGRVCIYYEGGLIYEIIQKGHKGGDIYEVTFPVKYYASNENTANSLFEKNGLAILIRNEGDSSRWCDLKSELAGQMKKYHEGHSENCEQRTTYRIASENTFGGKCSQSDYYICDTEYVNTLLSKHKKDGRPFGTRIDLIGIKFERGEKDKSVHSGRLALFEMKYGSGALFNTSGMADHIARIKWFLEKPCCVDMLKREMEGILDIKGKLGFLAPDSPLRRISFSRDKCALPEYLFVITLPTCADFNLGKQKNLEQKLINSVNEIKAQGVQAEIKLALLPENSFMLSRDRLFTIDELPKLCSNMLAECST